MIRAFYFGFLMAMAGISIEAQACISNPITNLERVYLGCRLEVNESEFFVDSRILSEEDCDQFCPVILDEAIIYFGRAGQADVSLQDHFFYVEMVAEALSRLTSEPVRQMLSDFYPPLSIPAQRIPRLVRSNGYYDLADALGPEEAALTPRHYTSVSPERLERLTESGDAQCPICYEPFQMAQLGTSDKASAVALHCQGSHVFCLGCATEWYKSNPTCPQCRGEIQTVD